jgi:hypothetical protein
MDVLQAASFEEKGNVMTPVENSLVSVPPSVHSPDESVVAEDLLPRSNQLQAQINYDSDRQEDEAPPHPLAATVIDPFAVGNAFGCKLHRQTASHHILIDETRPGKEFKIQSPFRKDFQSFQKGTKSGALSNRYFLQSLR